MCFNPSNISQILHDSAPGAISFSSRTGHKQTPRGNSIQVSKFNPIQGQDGSVKNATEPTNLPVIIKTLFNFPPSNWNLSLHIAWQFNTVKYRKLQLICDGSDLSIYRKFSVLLLVALSTWLGPLQTKTKQRENLICDPPMCSFNWGKLEKIEIWGSFPGQANLKGISYQSVEIYSKLGQIILEQRSLP